MPIEAKPLFRPDVLRRHLDAFDVPPHVEALRPKLADWAELLASGRAKLRAEYARSIEPARAIATEAQTLENEVSPRRLCSRITLG